MEKIPINEETLKQFQNGSFTDPDNAGADGHNEDIPTAQESVKQLNEAVGWLLKTADSALRNKDERLGTDPESIDRISELSVIVAKRNLSDDILRNSPELFLGTILAGLAIEKGIVLKQIQSEQEEQPQPKKEEEKAEDNE